MTIEDPGISLGLAGEFAMLAPKTSFSRGQARRKKCFVPQLPTVEFIAVRPLFFDIVDFEGAVWWSAWLG